MSKLVCKIEQAIGETRACVYHGKTPIEFHLWRASQAGLARIGDVFVGKITKIEKEIMAAFIDLGPACVASGDNGENISKRQSGLLRFAMAKGAPKLSEGQMVQVKIKRQAENNKGALVEFLQISNAKRPAKTSANTLQDFISARFGDINFIQAKVSGLGALLESEIALASGGSISIEHTRAGTMIDVDSGTAPKFKTAIEAAKLAARQIRLRGIGGLILVDFPNLRAKKQRADLWQTFSDGFNSDVSTVKIAPLSRFGTIEMTRAKFGPSLSEICLDRCGRLTAETIAITGLRRLQLEAGKTGEKLVLALPKAGLAWLEENKNIWQSGLNDRIGKRYSLKSANSIDVYKAKND